MSDSIAITSGKGGVGKTTLCANLAIAFKKLMNTVLLLDTDLGMANSHVLMGLNPKESLSRVISGNATVKDIICNTPSGVELVSGGAASYELLNLNNNQRYNLINSVENYLKEKDKVKLIVDIAAGAEDNSIFFSNACNRIVVVVVGEPTSFIDSYALIKAINQSSGFREFCILINQADNSEQGKQLFNKFSEITSRFLDINLHYVGFVEFSKKIKRSIIDRKPIISSDPKSDISLKFQKIAMDILNTPKNFWGGLSFFRKTKQTA